MRIKFCSSQIMRECAKNVWCTPGVIPKKLPEMGEDEEIYFFSAMIKYVKTYGNKKVIIKTPPMAKSIDEIVTKLRRVAEGVKRIADEKYPNWKTAIVKPALGVSYDISIEF